jgi:hypothetical protein
MKSLRLFDMQAVVPPSTRMSKESDSKIAREEVIVGRAELTRATPAVTADWAKIRLATRKGGRLRACHHKKFHLQNRY